MMWFHAWFLKYCFYFSSQSLVELMSELDWVNGRLSWIEWIVLLFWTLSLHWRCVSDVMFRFQWVSVNEINDWIVLLTKRSIFLKWTFGSWACVFVVEYELLLSTGLLFVLFDVELYFYCIPFCHILTIMRNDDCIVGCLSYQIIAQLSFCSRECFCIIFEVFSQVYLWTGCHGEAIDIFQLFRSNRRWFCFSHCIVLPSVVSTLVFKCCFTFSITHCRFLNWFPFRISDKISCFLTLHYLWLLILESSFLSECAFLFFLFSRYITFPSALLNLGPFSSSEVCCFLILLPS